MRKMTRRKPKRRKLFRFVFRLLILACIVVGMSKIVGVFSKADEAPGAELPMDIKIPFVKKQGRITIKNIDIDNQHPIKNSEFTITKLDTGELIDRIITDKDGLASSSLLDYDSVYEIKRIEAHPYYQSSADDIFTIEVNQENHELIIENKMHDYIKQTNYSEDGDIVIDEIYIDVPTVMQNPELPNGCEITSLTAVLNYNGYDVDKLVMADVYLPKEPFAIKNGKLYGANPYVAYAGNPREKSGFFSYAPPIIEAAKSYLNTVDGKETPIDISGSSREQIVEYLNQGKPVVIWVTLDLSKPKLNYSWYLTDTGEKKDMPVNLHCVVLNGYLGDNVHVMNPLKGQVIYNADEFFQSYVDLGSHALILQ